MRDLLTRAFGAIAPRQERYTAAEVQARLRQDPAGEPRTAAVHAAAAETGIWMSLLDTETAFELGRAAARLPSVVFWFVQGRPAADVGRDLHPFGGTFDAEHALETASWLIATALNRAPARPVAVSRSV
jgi:hypothetical protein